MKDCAYCGRENKDDAVRCFECGTDSFKSDPPPEPTDLPRLDPQEELVTLVAHQKLVDADILIGRLEAAGIEAFMPDEFLMQTIGFGLNTYGYVRVQVRRKDYANARGLLSAANEDSQPDIE